jgi:hypothetical protein
MTSVIASGVAVFMAANCIQLRESCIQFSGMNTDEMIRELYDRQQISDVMLRFGRGLDLHDWEIPPTAGGSAS